MKAWGSGGMAPTFMTSALDGGQWSASRPGLFILGERAPVTHWFGGRLGPREEKNRVPSWNRTPADPPIA
jgi:hypothetical protein